MGIDEKNTDQQIKTDAFVRRMPSHRSQRPARKSAEGADAGIKERTRERIAETSKKAAFAENVKETAAHVIPDTVAAEGTKETPQAETVKETAAEVIPDTVAAEGTKETPQVEVVPDTTASEAEKEGAAQGKAPEPALAETEKEPEKEQEAEPKAEPETKKEKQEDRGFSGWVRKHKPLTVILATILLLLIVLVVLFARGSNLNSKKTDNFMDQIRGQEIKINDVAAIDDFFVAYYTALSSGNTTELETMFDDPAKANITTEISTIVSQYDNFQIYVTPGIEENDIVAFVSNDVHFDNIEATAPSVDSFYLKYDTEASALLICSDMYTDQTILKYMNLVSYREPIRSLLSDTNNRLSDALAGNKDLNNLYILMQSMTESAGASETETTEE